MSQAASDRNLLFGILAVQLDFVAADQLIAAMNRWVLDKRAPLGNHLEQIGALPPDARQLLEALVDKHVEQHGGQVEHSLAAISSATPVVGRLSGIVDPQLQTSLGRSGQTTRAIGSAPPARQGRPASPDNRYATLPTPSLPDDAIAERFRILRPHAMGGLGKVSIARDSELNREVALKELQDRHADDPDSRARFLLEAEITGGLEHPGVVPIYGLGQYADGRPFYAMRFIRGDSLAEAIERFHRQAEPSWSSAADVLQLRRLLARMIDVCNAIEYAHSRGVLHRDLKPGNVMLGQYGETLVVDWGLAKPVGKSSDPAPAAAASDSDVTLVHSWEEKLTPQSGSAPTQMGSAVGTPAFMSPEQAAGRLDLLGPASDVYSLGGTLYMLLTGKPPQQDHDLGVVLQRVQRGEFHRPRELKPAVPRGLEAICLKAMALQPEDRYASPRKLADDLEAWLADEPIAAVRETWLARSRRWVKKHRTLVTSAAAMLLVAAAASSLGVVFLTAANQREREATESAVAAQQAAERSQREAERQAARNDELLEFARKSLAKYQKLADAPELNHFGMASFRRQLQEASLDYYETLAAQAGESEQDRRDRADALYRLGSTYWQLGIVDNATATVRQSLDMYRQLERQQPADAAYGRGAALALVTIGKILVDAQRADEAADPLAECQRRLAELRTGESAELNDSLYLAFALSTEGERLRQKGRLPDAVDAFQRGLEILRGVDASELAEDQRRDVEFRLSRALSQLATLESQALWKFSDGRAHFAEAEQVMQALWDRAPEVTNAGLSLVQILRNEGFLAGRENRIDEARELYERAVGVLTKVEANAPEVPELRQEMAELLHSLGQLRHPLSPDPPDAAALAKLESAVAIGMRLVELYPQETGRRQALTRYQSSLGRAYRLVGRNDDARQALTASLDNLNSIVDDSGASLDTLYTLGELQRTVAEQMIEAGQLDAAAGVLNDAEARFHQLIKFAPQFGEAHLSLANVYVARSNLRHEQGYLVDAVVDLNRAAAKSSDISGFAEAPWLQSGMKSMVLLANAARWQYLSEVRSGGLNQLFDRGDYQAAARQARQLPELTGEARDHYVAALALAHGAKAIAADAKNAKFDEAARAARAEELASQAVQQLSAAWEGGAIRRSAGFAGLFSSAPTLTTLRQEDELTGLRERADFRALLNRIETEPPPARNLKDRDPSDPTTAK